MFDYSQWDWYLNVTKLMKMPNLGAFWCQVQHGYSYHYQLLRNQQWYGRYQFQNECTLGLCHIPSIFDSTRKVTSKLKVNKTMHITFCPCIPIKPVNILYTPQYEKFHAYPFLKHGKYTSSPYFFKIIPRITPQVSPSFIERDSGSNFCWSF